MTKIAVTFLCLLAIGFHGLVYASGLHTSGSDLFDANNTKVRLTGVNWFGMETSNMCPHGLWARDWKGVLIQIKQMGFNCIRFPWCNAMLRSGARANSVNYYGIDPFRQNASTDMNKELVGKSPLEIMDIIMAGCQELGIAVILDNHSREPDGYMNEMVWYTTTTSEQQWIDDWVFLSGRYKTNPFVVGCDLDNEPHGKKSAGGSQWGGDAAYDWKSAAQRCGNAILAVNANVLIVVEGVEQFDTTTYWWGGNFRGVHNNPVVLTDNTKLVYSPHDYGPEVFAQPWFNDPAFPANLPTVWDSTFAFIKNENKAPVLLGEFGIRDSSSANGKAKTWFLTLLSTLCKSISWTFWCLNPNSGDTGGLLGNDWTTPEQWKVDMLKPYMAPFLNLTTSVSQPQQQKKFEYAVDKTANFIVFHGELSKRFELNLVSLDGKVLRKSVGSGALSVSTKNMVQGVYICALRDHAGLLLETRLVSLM
jgi:aryl-phospho-beta-D-glucosidase BglC (GH1 family)